MNTTCLIRLGVCFAGLSLPLFFGACSEDSEPNGATGGTAGSAGSGDSGSAGSAGDAGAGGRANGGSAGDSGGGGDSGAAGSAGPGDAGSAGSAPDAGDGDAATAAFGVSSPAFDSDEGCAPDNADPCAFFPNENTQLGGGESLSPEINWVNPPAGTASFAIALHDLSFTPGEEPEPFTHWVMWNIPASATGLPAALPGGAQPGVPAANTQQVNYMDTGGFLGSGGCGNVYEFVLYALSTPTFDPEATDSDEVQQALEDSDDVLGTATMRARSDGAGPGC